MVGPASPGSGLEAVLAPPRPTFGGADLYPGLTEKIAALGFALIQNHPFVDGTKGIGHAAMETFLLLNGQEFAASVTDAEAAVLGVASGRWTQEDLRAWVARSLRPVPPAG